MLPSKTYVTREDRIMNGMCGLNSPMKWHCPSRTKIQDPVSDDTHDESTQQCDSTLTHVALLDSVSLRTYVEHQRTISFESEQIPLTKKLSVQVSRL